MFMFTMIMMHLNMLKKPDLESQPTIAGQGTHLGLKEPLILTLKISFELPSAHTVCFNGNPLSLTLWETTG